MRFIKIFLLCMLCVVPSYAKEFHYGNEYVELTTVKHTFPSLNILDGGVLYYGAMYTAPFPEHAVHILDNGIEYFVGPWCDAGTYLPDYQKTCVPCGPGHYCTGGRHRATCTYGAIACNGNNFTYDPPMPAGTDGMYNRALTMAEVNQYVPQTDISQWEAVYVDNPSNLVDNPANLYDSYREAYYDCTNNPNDPRLSFFNQEIPYGTYLVMHFYPSISAGVYGQTSSITGHTDWVSTAYIVVFDHNVGYRPTHICGYFGHYFDTTHIPYQEYNLALPPEYLYNQNLSNVTNMSHVLDTTKLYLYRLK